MGKGQSKIINQENYKGMIDETYRDPIIWKFFINVFEFFIYFLYPKKKANPELIDELKKEVSNYKKLNYTNSQAYNDWVKHANRTREMILKKDPSMFLRWYPIRNTMNISNSKFVLIELKSLKRTKRWDNFWKDFIKEPFIGGQIPFIFDFSTSGNTIHLAYIINEFEKKINKNISDFDYIFEFGGGYGNLCRLIHKRGFNGKYVLFDMPVFSSLQKFYLKSVGLSIFDFNDIEEIKNKKSGIFCIKNIDEIIKILEETDSNNPMRNLFIATWSISESPIYIREKFHKFISNFNYFLIAYQDKFGEVNNKEYFKNLKRFNPKARWHDWSLEHLPGHNILIGLK
jgi:putative sugar O-methyltransferase